MRIFRALGFGIVIIIIRVLMSDIFHAFENTAITFFETLSIVLSSSSQAFSDGSFMPAAVIEYPEIPQW